MLVEWQSRASIETAGKLAQILEAMLPLARAANPDYVLVLLEMVGRLRGGLFLTTQGRDPTIALLSRVDLIVADLQAIQAEKDRASATGPAPGGATPAQVVPAAPTDNDKLDPHAGSIAFDPIEKAIVLLLRDGRNPRSMRDYAKDVGVDHSKLSRSDKWQVAWKAATAEEGDLPQGSKDAEGNVEASRPEFCENCGQESIVCSVTVKGEAVRVCEACAKKLAPRTNPRTS